MLTVSREHTDVYRSLMGPMEGRTVGMEFESSSSCLPPDSWTFGVRQGGDREGKGEVQCTIRYPLNRS